MGRPRSCECGVCPKCRNRIREAARWAGLSARERAETVARRDPAKLRRLSRTKRRNRTVENAAKAAHKRRHPERNRAREAVRRAVRAGTLERGECEREGPDCEGPIQAHHEDYSRPLDVRWLCRGHHYEEHRTMRAFTAKYDGGPCGLDCGEKIKEGERCVFIDDEVCHSQCAQDAGYDVVDLEPSG